MDQRIFFLKPRWQEASHTKVKDKDSILGTERVCLKTLRQAEMLQDAWGTKHWAITCAALVKQFGCYSKENKKPVRSFQQRSDIKWLLFYKSHLGSSVKKDVGWRTRKEELRMEEPGRKRECPLGSWSVLWRPGQERRRLWSGGVGFAGPLEKNQTEVLFLSWTSKLDKDEDAGEALFCSVKWETLPVISNGNIQ